MSLSEVIDCSTRKPADAIARPDLGRLKTGAEADISILKFETGKYSFADADQGEISADSCLKARGVVKGGVYRVL